MDGKPQTTPSSAEIKRFIEVFNALDKFDATMRHIRGYGALPANQLPVPEVIAVMKWLGELAA